MLTRLLISQKPRVFGIVVLFIWSCLVVDVLTFMPKRAVYALERAWLTADEKLFELWGGLHTISEELKSKKLLGAKVGVPDQEYANAHSLIAPYSHPNYCALAYPGRTVTVKTREDLETLKPNFLILDNAWPEFNFSGDPRMVGNGFVDKPKLVQVAYD